MGILQSASTEQTITSSYKPAYITATLYLSTFLSDTSHLQTTRTQNIAQTKRCLKNHKKQICFKTAFTEQTVIGSYPSACVAPSLR
ncbi:hypothetical protein D3C71_857340 [compost metagenome]